MIRTTTMMLASLSIASLPIASVASAQQYQFVFDHAELLPEVTIDGQFVTIHTQGLYVTDEAYWVTGRLEKIPKRALLLKFSRDDSQAFELIDITPPATDGATLDHPGGFDVDPAGNLWIPLSTSDPAGPSLICRVVIHPNQPLSTAKRKVAFQVDDHIGAICVAQDGTLVGANWDTKRVYVWSRNGEVVKSVDRNRIFADTPQWKLAVQDWKRFDLKGGDIIIAGGLEKSGASSQAIVQLIDVVHGRLHASHRFPRHSQVARPITNEGLDIHKRGLFLLPEDIGRGAKVLHYKIISSKSQTGKSQSEKSQTEKSQTEKSQSERG